VAQDVFQPSVETIRLAAADPVSGFCWSGTSGMTNLGFGSQFAFGVWPTVAWPSQVKLA